MHIAGCAVIFYGIRGLFDQFCARRIIQRMVIEIDLPGKAVLAGPMLLYSLRVFRQIELLCTVADLLLHRFACRILERIVHPILLVFDLELRVIQTSLIQLVLVLRQKSQSQSALHQGTAEAECFICEPGFKQSQQRITGGKRLRDKCQPDMVEGVTRKGSRVYFQRGDFLL